MLLISCGVAPVVIWKTSVVSFWGYPGKKLKSYLLWETCEVWIDN